MHHEKQDDCACGFTCLLFVCASSSQLSLLSSVLPELSNPLPHSCSCLAQVFLNTFFIHFPGWTVRERKDLPHVSHVLALYLAVVPNALFVPGVLGHFAFQKQNVFLCLPVTNLWCHSCLDYPLWLFLFFHTSVLVIYSSNSFLLMRILCIHVIE